MHVYVRGAVNSCARKARSKCFPWTFMIQTYTDTWMIFILWLNNLMAILMLFAYMNALNFCYNRYKCVSSIMQLQFKHKYQKENLNRKLLSMFQFAKI